MLILGIKIKEFTEIEKLIIKISEIELQIKKNSYNPINITLDFIFDQSSKN